MLSDIGERQLGSQYQNNLKVTLHSYLNNTLSTLHLASGLSGYPAGRVKILFSQHLHTFTCQSAKKMSSMVSKVQ